MVKTILFFSLLFSTIVSAEEPSEALKINCINCHIEQKIPSELIYRRYLQKYSTHKAIKETLLSYLRNPSKKTSIMPKQFFLKFPEKKALDMNETIFSESIDAYLDYFDIKKKLVLPTFSSNWSTKVNSGKLSPTFSSAKSELINRSVTNNIFIIYTYNFYNYKLIILDIGLFLKKLFHRSSSKLFHQHRS
ncbi:MAG TPA: hypothetical protein EYG94_06125 [Campylobacterales bacterium]|nr:hypothetical protein [Campylobacterales bacterium]